MTLLEWASPWDSSNSSNNRKQNESNDNSKKRTSTMGNSMRKINVNDTNNIDSSRYSNVNPHLETSAIRSDKSYNEGFRRSEADENSQFQELANENGNNDNQIMTDSMKIDKIVNEQRQNNINKLLEKMSLLQVTDDGSGLTNFNPPARPEINKKNNKENFTSQSPDNLDSKQNRNGSHTLTPKDLLPNKQSESYSSMGDDSNWKIDGRSQNDSQSKNLRSATNDNYIPVKSPIFKGANGMDSGDYRKIYDSGSGSSNTEGYVPYYARSNYNSESKSSIGDDQLLKKINYMIHLLEEQRKEKTDNITEEFLLYSFLGIFIIYIVDSFSRSGKYTR